jgi:hypothetical protein
MQVEDLLAGITMLLDCAVAAVITRADSLPEGQRASDSNSSVGA